MHFRLEMKKPVGVELSEDVGEELVVRHVATANLPTKHGHFTIWAFENNRDGKEHVAIVAGEVQGEEDVLTRIHSECVTGDVFSSLKCDCGEQLDRALAHINGIGKGIVLYMRQEGRGIGLTNKVRAYSLQDQGMDTVEANHHLGFDDDLRDYEIAAEMLHILGVKSIELLTNNPKKISGLQANGIKISERRPIRILANPFNTHYLTIKKNKSGHIL